MKITRLVFISLCLILSLTSCGKKDIDQEKLDNGNNNNITIEGEANTVGVGGESLQGENIISLENSKDAEQTDSTDYKNVVVTTSTTGKNFGE